MNKRVLYWPLWLMALLLTMSCGDSGGETADSKQSPPEPSTLDSAATSRPVIRLAILPIVNASQRWVDQSELLSDFFPVALGEILQSCPAVQLLPERDVETGMAQAGIKREGSLSDATLIDLSRKMKAYYAVSWEPAQDSQLNPFLRVRLVDCGKGEIAYRKDFPSGAQVALFGTFLTMYRDALLPAAADLMKIMLPHDAIPSGDERIAGDWSAQAMETVERALTLEHPVRVRREMEARAYALASIAMQQNPGGAEVNEAMAFAAWVNGLHSQSLALLQALSREDGLPASSRALLSLLKNEPPPPLGMDKSAPAVRARHYAQWWQDDAAAKAQEEFLRSWLQGSSPGIPQQLHVTAARLALFVLTNSTESLPPVSARDFLLGKGPLTEKLAKAAAAPHDSEKHAYGLALAEEAWLAAWTEADLKPNEIEIAREAFAYAQRMFPSSAAILTEKAHYFRDIAPDARERNDAVAAARKADPAFVPAAQLAAILRAPSMKPPDRPGLFESVRSMAPFDNEAILWAAANVAQAGDIGRAQSLINQAHALSPMDSASGVATLDLYWRQRLQSIDEATVEGLLKDYPVTPELQLAAARLHYRNGRPEIAEPLARALFTKYPDNLEVALLLAEIETYLGRHEEAVSDLDAFLNRGPNSLQRLTAMEKRAAVLDLAGRKPDALAAWKEAASYAPDNERVQLAHGLSLKKNGHDDESLQLFQSLFAVSKDARAALEAGRILIGRKQLDEALVLAREAQKAQPRSPAGYELEAEAEIARGNARQGFEAMARLARNNEFDPLADLAGARVLNAIKRYDQAAASARQGLLLRNGDAEKPLLIELARAAIESRNMALAGDAFDQLRHLYFDDPEALILLARESIAEDEMERARDLLQRVLRIDPANEDATDFVHKATSQGSVPAARAEAGAPQHSTKSISTPRVSE